MLSNPFRRTALLQALFSCGLITLCVLPAGAWAAGRGNPTALTVEQAGPDYALVGEFAGNVTGESAQPQRMAIQIRAAGARYFEAAEYTGGLPGENGHKPGASKLYGFSVGNFLVLSGGPHAILANSDRCLVIDGEGKQIGRLDRVTRASPTQGARPPRDAIVVFDNQDTGQLTRPRVTEDGLLMPGTDIKPLVQDFILHLEFMLPSMPTAGGQERANSGVYIHGRYELQILDSFAQEPAINGSGAIYEYIPPEINMCLPPLVWQTYDIVFTSPRWSADNTNITKLKNARLSLWYNGVQIHKDIELARKTGLGSEEGPQVLPIKLQDHNGDPVRFRNIWIVDRGAAMPQKLDEMLVPPNQPAGPAPASGGNEAK
jgi:hypothetical protein